jgi:hypothetical protein
MTNDTDILSNTFLVAIFRRHFFLDLILINVSSPTANLLLQSYKVLSVNIYISSQMSNKVLSVIFPHSWVTNFCQFSYFLTAEYQNIYSVYISPQLSEAMVSVFFNVITVEQQSVVIV